MTTTITAPALPIQEHRYTAVLTPRGAAARILIRRNWLRDLTATDRADVLAVLCESTPGLTADDQRYLAELLDAHQTGA